MGFKARKRVDVPFLRPLYVMESLMFWATLESYARRNVGVIASGDPNVSKPDWLRL